MLADTPAARATSLIVGTVPPHVDRSFPAALLLLKATPFVGSYKHA
ncbi:hypothetical protein Acsp01_45770 [Actinoplanes sp. NBRC 101535]|nr:hypothetical protein Acsp01_45770 [Actinoplanes sp. NBRC 101535]